MIPVRAQPEPPHFDAYVRQPGLAWLNGAGIALSRRIPPKTMVPPLWRLALDDLHARYQGVCAYLCVFVERCTGGVSVDHYVAKSRAAGQAFEWANYRLACTTMNSRKRDYSTVLDPFTLAPDTFFLELITGRIYPNPAISVAQRRAARVTIRRLGLDGGLCREMRARRYSDYLTLRGRRRSRAAEANLRRYAPFLWYEADRQGLL